MWYDGSELVVFELIVRYVVSKLEPYVELDDYSDFDSRFVRDLQDGFFDDADEESLGHVTYSGLIPKRIVESYLATGEYCDIDCPGGIEQMVKDYRDGKFER